MPLRYFNKTEKRINILSTLLWYNKKKCHIIHKNLILD